MCECLCKPKISIFEQKFIGKTLYGEITDVLDGATLLIDIQYGDSVYTLKCVLYKCERFSYNYITKEDGYLRRRNSKKSSLLSSYDCSSSEYYSKTTNMFVSLLKNTHYFSLELIDLKKINKELKYEPIKCHLNIIGYSNDHYIISLYHSTNLSKSVNDLMLERIF
jgi:hypothetical protein